MPRGIALFVSGIFHPIFINLLSFVLLLRFDAYLSARLSGSGWWFYVLYVFITTSLIPLIIVLLRKLMGFTDSIMLTEAEDRHLPYIVTATCYLFGYYFFREMHLPDAMQAYMLASSTIMVAVLVINFFIKISAHATALGALFGLMLALAPQIHADMRLTLCAILGISGLVLTSRLALKAHSYVQLYSGFVIGAGLMCLIMGT